MPISARNKLRGTIEVVRLGDVMAHVVVRVADDLIESAITRRSAEELKLKKGDTVFAVVKATGNDSERLTSYCTSTIFQRRDLYPTSHSFFTRNNDPVPPR
jgi:molybdopterin-binding protein